MLNLNIEGTVAVLFYDIPMPHLQRVYVCMYVCMYCRIAMPVP